MRATAAESPYYTYAQAEAYCNVHRTTLYRAAKAGRLASCGPGSAVRFHKEQLDSWMKSRARK